MFLFGHLGITLGLFFILGYLVPGIRGRINYWFVALGAVLPDIIDKLLGRVLFANSLASGRLIAHTLIFILFLALVGLYLHRRSRDARMLLVSGASLLHLLEDHMWAQPVTFLWPLLGWSFPRGAASDDWIDYFLVTIRNSYTPDFSYVFISEIIGFTIITLLLAYLFSRTKADHQQSHRPASALISLHIKEHRKQK
ncbi:putative membrane-bound metal-dependent hydrolase (DUF457) [Candidatus Methanoperedens nitroreducens]|uniref:Putative membrane-bound metal-dependent hydrolase (DUF457) n=1 Tax=Candidatus Methanoperedens nitratireducens TaxID=1392998 RepID=A0A062V8Y0_9EURY|nr:metal-dependent hydrolase [Candidatus Methanoperedens nitroreducens]KCZ72224.1 putative membrane-bound metal-dependent hydrolase (DUF457) [Candidatus Methanoperedens nitroreducens]MDJ1421799.1 metal-dependent hydrolase [Candidatus Methanoperedens sp.]